jgi:hypothetical protein
VLVQEITELGLDQRNMPEAEASRWVELNIKPL